MHYHIYVFRDTDAEGFDEDQERLKALLEEEMQNTAN